MRQTRSAVNARRRRAGIESVQRVAEVGWVAWGCEMKEMSSCAGQSEALTSHPANPDLQVGEIGVTRFVASRDKMRGSFAALEDDGEKQATARAFGFGTVLPTHRVKGCAMNGHPGVAVRRQWSSERRNYQSRCSSNAPSRLIETSRYLRELKNNSIESFPIEKDDSWLR